MITSENLIRSAIDRIGGVPGEVLAILLCLSPGTLGTILEARRQQAVALVGIMPDTFRRERYEGFTTVGLGVGGPGSPPRILGSARSANEIPRVRAVRSQPIDRLASIATRARRLAYERAT